MPKYFQENYMSDASNVICRPSQQLKEGGGTYSKSGSGWSKSWNSSGKVIAL